MSSSFSEDQLQPDDTLDDRGTDDVLDEGMSPPERPSRDVARGTTPREDAQGETLEDRLEQEEPDPVAEVDHSAEDPAAAVGSAEGADPSDGFEVGDDRTGRLAEPETASAEQGGLPAATDAGIDGAAASAEEAAVHTVDEDLP